jgi:hypothetical protein
MFTQHFPDLNLATMFFTGVRHFTTQHPSSDTGSACTGTEINPTNTTAHSTHKNLRMSISFLEWFRGMIATRFSTTAEYVTIPQRICVSIGVKMGKKESPRKTWALQHLYQDQSFSLRMIQKAWIRPGKYPNKVKRIFNQKCTPKPTWRKTPTGGNKIEQIIRRTSMKNLHCLVREF